MLGRVAPRGDFTTSPTMLLRVTRSTDGLTDMALNVVIKTLRQGKPLPKEAPITMQLGQCAATLGRPRTVTHSVTSNRRAGPSKALARPPPARDASRGPFGVTQKDYM